MNDAEVLVIGAGPAGLYAAEAASKSAKTVLAGSEKYLPYYRPRLSKILSGLVPPEELAIKKADWFTSRGIEFLPGLTAVKLEPQQKKVFWGDGSFTEYGRLILAAGSHSFIPAIPGVERPFALRSYDDAAAIHEAAVKNGRAVVFGGGLLGLETAYNLREAGVEVTVIERNAWLLNRQLPKEGGEYIASFLEKDGIQLVFNADMEKQQERTRDTCVVIAAGVRPNMEFLQGSGIRTDKAVVVDAFMRTNVPDIFACGDIAEYNGKSPGLWPVAMEQGKAAGANAVGANLAYEEVLPSPLLKVGNLSVFSAGDNGSGATCSESSGDAFRSVTLKDNILVGGVLIGDISKMNKLKNAIGQKREFTDVKSPEDVFNNL